jgi:hypothetical protein
MIPNVNLEYKPDVIDPPIKTNQQTSKTVPISDIVEINDVRNIHDFKSTSFSEYKKTDVKRKIIESLLSENVEPSCYWCCELLCAGHFGDVWEIILYYISKYIHIGNPKIAIYIEMRYNIFRNIMNQGTFISDLDARNHDSIRKLFAEIICVLTLSPKKPSIELMKIKSNIEFDVVHMSTKLKANNIEYIRESFLEKDPRELFIAMNEFAFSLSSNEKNMSYACYWIEWILEFEALCKKRKQLLKCEARNYKVENKFRTNVIWLLWDIILDYAELTNNPMTVKCVHSIKNLFLIKFTEGTPKKRKYLIYYAIQLITEKVNFNVPILPDKNIIQNITSQIDTIYKQIKKNEIAPKTEYLFNGLDKKKSIEKSLKQLEVLNKMENINEK